MTKTGRVEDRLEVEARARGLALEDVRARAHDKIPAGRMAEPDEIAQMALASRHRRFRAMLQVRSSRCRIIRLRHKTLLWRHVWRHIFGELCHWVGACEPHPLAFQRPSLCISLSYPGMIGWLFGLKEPDSDAFQCAHPFQSCCRSSCRDDRARLSTGFSGRNQPELAAIQAHPEPPAATGAQDLRGLLWSSIDNDTSRDLDQIEWAEQLADGRIRVLVGVADVDARVAEGTIPTATPERNHLGLHWR